MLEKISYYYRQKKSKLTPLLCYMLISCNTIDKNPLIVEIKSTKSNNIAFLNSYHEFPFKFVHEEYPVYYDYLLSRYKNLPSKDFYIVVAYHNHSKFIYDLYKTNFISKEKYDYYAQRLRLQPELEEKKPELSILNALTAIENGRQYLIVDTNSNYDFGDEQKIFLDARTQTPNYTYTYEHFLENKSWSLSREISISPNPDYYAFQRTKDTLARKLGITAKFNDYWKGICEIEGQKYEVALQGYNSKVMNIYFKVESLSFSSNDEYYNQNFAYRLKDTMKLKTQLFTLDSIAMDISSIYLKPLDRTLQFTSNHRLGDIIEKISLKNLEGEELTLFSGVEETYTLLDFWGTWCFPCIEMTPAIKRLHHTYTDKLKVVGVAVDKSPKAVQRYCHENDLNWPQAFIELNDFKNPFLKNLKVPGYPTLILVDKNNRIVFRGSDSSAIDKIEQILKNNP